MIADTLGPNAEVGHRQFKKYLTLNDPRAIPPPRKDDSNYKVNPIIKQMVHTSKKAMNMGQNIIVDEQMMGFKGAHADVIRITFKNEGDGFRCEAVCADGYTFTVYFRNIPAPNELLDKYLSPLHARVISMLEQLEDSN